MVARLIASPYRVRSVLTTSRGLRALGDELGSVEAPVYLVPQDLMEAICGFDFHRGVLAVGERRPQPDLVSAVAGAELVLGVEGVTDTENLGSLFRNAAAFGVGAVVVDRSSADPLYRRAVRVSMGQVLRLRFCRVPTMAGGASELRTLGFEVLALTPQEGAEGIATVGPGAPRVLLVGSEGHGLSDAALAVADRRVRIPMAPGADSLNVAVAAAVALHHLRGD